MSGDENKPDALSLPVLLKTRSDGFLALQPLLRKGLKDGGLRSSFRQSDYNALDSDSEDGSSMMTVGNRVIEAGQGPTIRNDEVRTGVFYSIVILVLNAAFLFGGTFAFMHYENKGKRVRNAESFKKLAHFEGHIDNATVILNRLLEIQNQMCRKSNDRAGNDWVFWGAFQYCNTVITTLGYGLVYPHTAIAKYLTMIYGLLGIPVFMAYVSYTDRYIYASLLHLQCVIQRLTHWNWMTRSVVRVSILRALILTVILGGYMGLHLWIVFPAERDWNEAHFKRSPLTMLYWQTVRFTTIGFGDIVVLLDHEIPKLLTSTMLGLPLGISTMKVYYTTLRSITGTKLHPTLCGFCCHGKCTCCSKDDKD